MGLSDMENIKVKFGYRLSGKCGPWFSTKPWQNDGRLTTWLTECKKERNARCKKPDRISNCASSAYPLVFLDTHAARTKREGAQSSALPGVSCSCSCSVLFQNS